MASFKWQHFLHRGKVDIFTVMDSKVEVATRVLGSVAMVDTPRSLG